MKGAPYRGINGPLTAALAAISAIIPAVKLVKGQAAAGTYTGASPLSLSCQDLPTINTVTSARLMPRAPSSAIEGM
jgi:hypothetical protein